MHGTHNIKLTIYVLHNLENILCDFIFSQWAQICYMFQLHAIKVARIALSLGAFTLAFMK